MLLELFVSFLLGGGAGLLLRDALSGVINEWGKKWVEDYWSEKKRKRELRNSLGEEILELITKDLDNFSDDPRTGEIISLKQRISGHNRRIASMLWIYSKVRAMLNRESKRLLKKGGYFSEEDMKMIGRFGNELSIMHDGLTIEAHYLMGNGIWLYRIERIKLFLSAKVFKKDKSSFSEETLQEVINKSQKNS